METSVVFLVLCIVGLATETSAMISRLGELDTMSWPKRDTESKSWTERDTNTDENRRQLEDMILKRLAADNNQPPKTNGSPILQLVRILDVLEDHELGIAETTRAIISRLADLLHNDTAESQNFYDSVKQEGEKILKEHGGPLPDTDEADDDDDIEEARKRMVEEDPTANTVVGRLTRLGDRMREIRAFLESLFDHLEDMAEPVEVDGTESTGTDNGQQDDGANPDIETSDGDADDGPLENVTTDGDADDGLPDSATLDGDADSGPSDSGTPDGAADDGTSDNATPDKRLGSSNGEFDAEDKRVLVLEKNLLKELVKKKLRDLLIGQDIEK